MQPHRLSRSRLSRVRATLLLGALILIPGLAAAETVVLFQPGQSSWEWLLVPSKHDGGKRMREGKSCLFCHEDEARLIGEAMVDGHDLEPQPVAGMPGVIEAAVSAAYDAENLYLSACWDSPDGGSPWGQASEDARLTFSLGTPELNVAPIAGCWAACHSDLPNMPDGEASAERTKYLPGSRNRMTASGGGDDVRSTEQIQAQLGAGAYLEYWQLSLEGQEVTGASDGYFLDHRVAHDTSVVSGSGTASGPDCSLELVRPLVPGGAGRHALEEGVEYTLNIALHANNAEGRHHFTSFPLRFRLGGGEAELVAVKR